MSTEHRKARLKHLIAIDFDGSQEKFAQKSERGKGRVSQMVGGNHPFGEAAGNKLAVDIGLPKTWFDNTWPTPKEAKRLGCRVDQPYPVESSEVAPHGKTPAPPMIMGIWGGLDAIDDKNADPLALRRQQMGVSLVNLLKKFDDQAQLEVAFAEALLAINVCKMELGAKPPKARVAKNQAGARSTPATPTPRTRVHR